MPPCWERSPPDTSLFSFPIYFPLPLLFFLYISVCDWIPCYYYASVGGAPEEYGSRRVCVSVCLSVCLYVFHAHFSATAKN